MRVLPCPVIIGDGRQAAEGPAGKEMVPGQVAQLCFTHTQMHTHTQAHMHASQRLNPGLSPSSPLLPGMGVGVGLVPCPRQGPSTAGPGVPDSQCLQHPPLTSPGRAPRAPDPDGVWSPHSSLGELWCEVESRGESGPYFSVNKPARSTNQLFVMTSGLLVTLASLPKVSCMQHTGHCLDTVILKLQLLHGKAS